MSNDTASLIQLISTVVAILAALASIYFSVRTHRDAMTQKRVQMLSLKRQFDSDMRKWAEAVSERMTDAIFLCDLDPKRLAEDEFFRKRHALRTKLSALIDRGRWFLPNEPDGEYGIDKPAAYQGHQQPSLDCVVETFNVVSKLDCMDQVPNKAVEAKLIKTKREFVAEIQTMLDPRHIKTETMKLIAAVRILGG